MNDKDAEKMAQKLSKAIDENATDEPALSINPKDGKPAVVGDPTKINRSKGKYSIEFAYHEDEITAEDKQRMKKAKEPGYYLLTMHYENKRIQPLYRAKIVALLTDIMVSMNLEDLDGYTSEASKYEISKAVLNKTDQIAELVRMVVGVPQDQIVHMTPRSLIDFMGQLINNEHNILKESTNFLS